jgi:hypothetical protein
MKDRKRVPSNVAKYLINKVYEMEVTKWIQMKYMIT